MSTSFVPLAAFIGPQPVSAHLTSVPAKDAYSQDAVAAAANLTQAQPQPLTNNLSSANESSSASPALLAIAVAAPAPPLTGATSAALTSALAPNQGNASSSSTLAPAGGPDNSNDTSTPVFVTSQSNSTQANTSSAGDTTPAPPQDLTQTAATQGNVVQTGAYSSVESSTASTIRGSGVDVIS